MAVNSSFIKAAKPIAKWAAWVAGSALPTPTNDFGHISNLEIKFVKTTKDIDTDSIFPVADRFITGYNISGKFTCHEADLDRMRVALGESAVVTATLNLGEGSSTNYFTLSFQVPNQAFTDAGAAKTSRLFTFRKCLVKADLTLKYSKDSHQEVQVPFEVIYDSSGSAGTEMGVIADS